MLIFSTHCDATVLDSAAYVCDFVDYMHRVSTRKANGHCAEKDKRTVKTTNSLSLFLSALSTIDLASFSLSFSLGFSVPELALMPFLKLSSDFKPTSPSALCLTHNSRCVVSNNCLVFGRIGDTLIGSLSLLPRRFGERASTRVSKRITSPGRSNDELIWRQFVASRSAKSSRAYKSTSRSRPLPCTGVNALVRPLSSS